MFYKKGQVLQDRQERFGRRQSYKVDHTPSYMDPAKRYTAGILTQLARCEKLGYRVVIRSTKYTNQERQKGNEGIIAGRNRLKRSLKLLNDVQQETNCFPELIDCIEVHNRDDLSSEDKELASQEPVFVCQWLEGYTLDRFGKRKKDALYQQDNTYWYKKKVEEIIDDQRLNQIDLKRLSRLIRALAIHCRSLLKCSVVHVDLKPEHVLILFKDEVPRLLGIGHLAPLDDRLELSPTDPVHAFTTAGFSAPELMNADTWSQPLDGEALMLYSLGAIALSIFFTGPKADLCEIWRKKGRQGIDDLLQIFISQGQQGNAKKLHFTEVISSLLDPNPKQRKAKYNLDKLIDELDPFAGKV